MAVPVIEAYEVIAGLYFSIEKAPLIDHDGCWEHQIDESWWVAMNGHPEPKQCSTGETVKPYNCYIKFNGFPAGIMSPFFGSIAAGELANETTFIQACRAATGIVSIKINTTFKLD